MTRHLTLLALLVCIAGAALISNCSSPLESYPNPNPPGPFFDVDTVIIQDTVYTGDSIIIIDTVLTSDTVIVVDTLFGNDTVFVVDTLFGSDTVIVVDTLFGGDTVIVMDTLIQTDTLFQSDTLYQTDTLHQVDTLVQRDTLVQTDTLFQLDTLVVIDTIFLPDTVIVYLPDTTTSGVMCTRLGSQQKEIIWLLRTAAGRYRLEIASYVESGQPPQYVTLVIDGVSYEWLPRDQPDFVIEADLSQYPTIQILPDKPGAYGHTIDFCLTVTPL